MGECNLTGQSSGGLKLVKVGENSLRTTIVLQPGDRLDTASLSVDISDSPFWFHVVRVKGSAIITPDSNHTRTLIINGIFPEKRFDKSDLQSLMTWQSEVLSIGKTTVDGTPYFMLRDYDTPNLASISFQFSQSQSAPLTSDCQLNFGMEVFGVKF